MWGSISEEGSCEEEELELVKAFLRDSDSDCEDAHSDWSGADCIRLGGADKPSVPQDQLCPLSSAHSSALSSKAVYESGLGSSTCRANSSSLLHLSSRLEASPDSGSPHSQGHSCLTTFQNGSEPSLDDQSAFHSVLSYASSTSVYEIESVEDCPVNKRKASWPVLGHFEKKSSPAESVSSAGVVKIPTPPPILEEAKQCRSDTRAGQGVASKARVLLEFAGDLISTGLPVDTLSAPTPSPSPLPYACSPPPASAYTAPWPVYQASLPGNGAVQTATVWRSPQGMIPIVPAAKSHYLSPARATQAGPMTTTASTKKISEALAEMSKLPLGSAGPLGLKLDKGCVTRLLREVGIKQLNG